MINRTRQRRPASIQRTAARLATTSSGHADEADWGASLAAQLFRSAFVSSVALAALADTLSLLGLIVPVAVRPLLAAREFAPSQRSLSSIAEACGRLARSLA
jgi:hypothetical protein